MLVRSFQHSDVELWISALVFGVNALFIGVPAGTARALRVSSSDYLRKSMIVVNWAFIGLWAFCVLYALFVTHRQLVQMLFGGLVTAYPAWINIKALGAQRATAELKFPDLVPPAAV